MTLTRVLIVVMLLCIPTGAFSQEEISYRKFKLDSVTCYAAVFYKAAPDGVDIGVSALPTGNGAEFRKWTIEDIKLHLGSERLRPDRSDNFYTTKESLFRIPAAILFAAIGTQINVSGSGLEQGIAKTGMALGLGLLVLQAHGDITGEKCVFSLNKEQVDILKDTPGFIEITMWHDELHLRESVSIGVSMPKTASQTPGAAYEKMGQDELAKIVDTLADGVKGLEAEQASYKYGEDPQYDVVQRKIEELETQRGLAYKSWFEKKQEKGHRTP